jgi:hypothetical protein
MIVPDRCAAVAARAHRRIGPDAHAALPALTAILDRPAEALRRDATEAIGTSASRQVLRSVRSAHASPTPMSAAPPRRRSTPSSSRSLDQSAGPPFLR